MSHQHNWIDSEKNGYYVCSDCGTYKSFLLLKPDDIYVEKDYWDKGDGTTGRSTLLQQIENMTCTDECGISKIDRVLQFVPKRGKNVLEIAAAPGIMLKKLLERNFNVFGIEPKQEYCQFISEQAPEAQVVCGYFPQVTKGSNDNIFDCIIGMDVFEHSSTPDEFIKEIHRLLIPGGTAILMSPIIYEDGFIRPGEFKSDEHSFIFTKRYLDPYLKEMFSKVEFKRWIISHELILLTK